MRDPIPMGMTPRDDTANLTLSFPAAAATASLARSESRRCLDEHADFFPSYRPGQTAVGCAGGSETGKEEFIVRGVKRVVCLANSRKLNGRCVAGREWADGRAGGWIRPVSNREHQEVSEYERQYQNGSDPRVLDIVDIPVLESRPADHQTENWLLDPKYYWVKVGRLSWLDLPPLAEDPVAPLWLDGHSTYNGLNDKIPLGLVGSLRDSLKLIHVNELQLSVFKPGEAFGNTKRRVQGDFRYAGSRYRLWVTDPSYERRYLAKPDGNYRIGERFLTVSLGESFEGACYKLIATVFAREHG